MDILAVAADFTRAYAQRIREGGDMDTKKPPMSVNIGRAPHLAMDRFNRIMEPGQLVMYRATMDLVFEVVDVRPVLNPALVAQGQQAMQVTLRAQFPVQVAAAVPSSSLVIIGETEARMKAQAKAAGDGQPEAAGPKLVVTDGE
jgi:hypothetical protein